MRRLLPVCIAVLLATSVHSPAEEPAAPSADSVMEKGLAFLASQQHAEGYFGTSQRPAATGLALMSFLASGHAPNTANVGKYGPNVGKAIDYLLAQAQADGSFGRSEKPMYAQAMATLALAQAYGIDDSEPRRRRIAAALAGSIKLIVTAQDVRKLESYAGGWRYEVNSADSDLTVTGWNVLALRACQDAGMNVPKGAFARALKFVLKCHSPAEKGFANQPGLPVEAGATAIGALCLRLLDAGTRAEALAAIATLAEAPPESDPTAAKDPYFGAYCQTILGFEAGDPLRRRVSTVTFEKIIKAQQTQADGGWPEDAADLPRAAESTRLRWQC